jgi:hypothetical protein
MTMILPFVGLVLLPLFLQKRSKSLLIPLCFLALGMAVAIAPCTIRNYARTGRLIPVNAQSWVAVWAGSVVKAPPDANVYQWWSIYAKDGAHIVRSVSKTGAASTVWFQKPVAMEDAFRAEAIANIKRSPGTYLANGARSFLSYNTDFNTAMIRFFKAYQTPPSIPKIKACLTKLPDDFPGETTANWFGYLLNALGVLALCGAAIAIHRRDVGMICVFVTYVTLALAHAVTFIDFFYYYSKIPFLCIFAGYFIAEVGRYKPKIAIRGHGVPTTGLLSAVLLAVNTALVVAIL